jgi:hypothetical protein
VSKDFGQVSLCNYRKVVLFRRSLRRVPAPGFWNVFGTAAVPFTVADWLPAELSSRDIRILYHARVATAAGKVLLYRTRREEVGCRQLDGATAVGSKG